MQQYTRAFIELGLEYIPSIANFISVKVGEAADIYELLLRQGVIVRPVANYAMPEYLRITIGTTQENERCIIALQQVMSR
jgi:histidinol-phosphate aminotransferase